MLALPGPSQPPSSALTALGPLFADQLQSMVAPLAALGPALQGIVSMLQAVPAAISSMQAQMDERDAKMQQKLQQTKDKNEELQVRVSAKAAPRRRFRADCQATAWPAELSVCTGRIAARQVEQTRMLCRRSSIRSK